MKYLPYENITYTTKLAAEEVRSRLIELVESPEKPRLKKILGSGSTDAYGGGVYKSHFEISRIIGYRNSFLPQIKGEVEQDYGETKVHVKMRLHMFVMIFMVLWLGGVGVGLVAVLTYAIQNETFEILMIIPAFMFVFGYALTVGAFKYESIKSKKFFAQLFEAKIEEG